jgi:hypothetical protein
MQQVYKDITGVMTGSMGKNISRFPRNKFWDFSKSSLERRGSVVGSSDSLKKHSQSLQAYSAENDEKFIISMIPPDGGKTAWLQVLACFLINVNNWGLVNNFGAYQSFYETNILSNNSPSEIAWIGTVQAALLLIVGVLSGPLLDKEYFRIMLFSSAFTLVFALMMLSLATQYYQIKASSSDYVGVSSISRAWHLSHFTSKTIEG